MKIHLADEHLTSVYGANQTQLTKYDRNCIFTGFVLNPNKSNEERLDFYKNVICRHIPSEVANIKWMQELYQVELNSNFSSIAPDNFSKNSVMGRFPQSQDIFSRSPLETVYDNQTKDNLNSRYSRILGVTQTAVLYTRLISATIGAKIQHGTIMESFIFKSYKGLKEKNVSIQSVLNKIARNPKESQFFHKVEFLAKLIVECDEDFSRTTKLVVDFLFYCSESKVIYVFENKDGGELDTKNMSGNIDEIKMTSRVIKVQVKANHLDLALHQVKPNLVMFSRDEISKSIISKVKGSEDFIITGRRFCEITGISYEEVETKSENFSQGNMGFIEKQILEMSKICQPM